MVNIQGLYEIEIIDRDSGQIISKTKKANTLFPVVYHDLILNGQLSYTGFKADVLSETKTAKEIFDSLSVTPIAETTTITRFTHNENASTKSMLSLSIMFDDTNEYMVNQVLLYSGHIIRQNTLISLLTLDASVDKKSNHIIKLNYNIILAIPADNFVVNSISENTNVLLNYAYNYGRKLRLDENYYNRQVPANYIKSVLNTSKDNIYTTSVKVLYMPEVEGTISDTEVNITSNNLFGHGETYSGYTNNTAISLTSMSAFRLDITPEDVGKVIKIYDFKLNINHGWSAEDMAKIGTL